MVAGVAGERIRFDDVCLRGQCDRRESWRAREYGMHDASLACGRAQACGAYGACACESDFCRARAGAHECWCDCGCRLGVVCDWAATGASGGCGCGAGSGGLYAEVGRRPRVVALADASESYSSGRASGSGCGEPESGWKLAGEPVSGSRAYERAESGAAVCHSCGVFAARLRAADARWVGARDVESESVFGGSGG